MGFSHSFVATKSISKARLLEGLGLTETDVSGDVDVPLGGFGLSELPGDWLLVACNDFDLPRTAPLAAISEGGELICAAIEEHVMFSEAAGFRDGLQIWRVQHDPDRSYDDLKVDGAPPAAFGKLRDEARAEQDREGGEDAGVDFIFDVPPRLAASLCGFEFGQGDGEFVQLTRIRKLKRSPAGRASKPGVLARLFGRR